MQDNDDVFDNHQIVVTELAAACEKALSELQEAGDIRIRILVEMLHIELARRATKTSQPDKSSVL